jgi:hypothetical protein
MHTYITGRERPRDTIGEHRRRGGIRTPLLYRPCEGISAGELGPIAPAQPKHRSFLPRQTLTFEYTNTSVFNGVKCVFMRSFCGVDGGVANALAAKVSSCATHSSYTPAYVRAHHRRTRVRLAYGKSSSDRVQERRAHRSLLRVLRRRRFVVRENRQHLKTK